MADIAELGLRIRSDGAREATSQLDRLSVQARRTEQATVGLQRNMQAANTGFSNLGPTVQNASFQIQDFAVQVGMGTDATRAFAQQFPQLVGGFGAWGAAIGAVVAIGAGLAPMLLSAGEEAKNAADATEDYADALTAYRDAVDQATAKSDDLIERFGSQADAMRETLKLAQQLAAQDALNAMRDSVKAVASEYEGLFTAVDNVARAQRVANDAVGEQAEIVAEIGLSAANAALREYANEMRITNDEAGQLRDALDAIGTASGIEGVLAATGELQDLMVGIYGTVENIPVELQKLLLEVTTAKTRTSELADTMQDAEDSAAGLASTDIASGIGAGADEAARLAEYMGISLQTAAKIAALGPQGIPKGNTDPSGRVYSGRGGDPREFGGSAADVQTREAAEFLANWEPPKITKPRARGRRGGGASGISDAERELEQFTRGLERFRTEEQQALADLMELEAGFERFGGQLSPEQVELYGQAIEGLRDSLADAGDGITDFGREAAAVFPSITEVMDDTRDAAGRLLSTLADRAWTAGLEQLFSGFGGKDSKGLLGGAIVPGILHDGGIAGVDGYDHSRRVSARIFDDAERYHNGGVAGLKPNEVPAILERGERVIPNGQSAGGTVELILRAAEGVTIEEVQNTAGAMIQSAAPAIRDQSVKATRRSINKSKAGWSIG